MKKWFLLIAFFVGAFVVFPAKTQAQYRSPYIYTNNAYLNYSLASARARKARAAAAKRKAVRNKSRKSVRRTRRVSSLETLNFRRDVNVLYSKRSEIV